MKGIGLSILCVLLLSGCPDEDANLQPICPGAIFAMLYIEVDGNTIPNKAALQIDGTEFVNECTNKMIIKTSQGDYHSIFNRQEGKINAQIHPETEETVEFGDQHRIVIRNCESNEPPVFDQDVKTTIRFAKGECNDWNVREMFFDI